VIPVDARQLPEVNSENEYFWRAGRDGVLSVLRCGDCKTWIHPPSPRCHECWSENLGPEAVSGDGTVFAYTVNHQAWRPDLDEQYVIAIVELAEQAGLRLTTNIIDCDPSAVHSGLRVRARFLEAGDVWLPMFVPTEE
jgi:uncharacterized OB-fold protein